MAFFSLSAITGCINETGTTTVYDIKYNDASIDTYYKKDTRQKVVGETHVDVYIVVCIFGNRMELFKFLTASDRDSFYASLP